MGKDDEMILVVKRSRLNELGAFEGLCFEPARYIESFFTPGQNFFTRRGEAEVNPELKQIIPYVVFTHAGKVLRYVRGGSSGEKRLVAKASIGIGGHVNDSDGAGYSLETYHRAVCREIAEELQIEDAWQERIIALINDESGEVGRVHLGIVHIAELQSAKISPGEEAIDNLEFLSIPEIRTQMESLETWSQMLVSNEKFLAQIGSCPGC